MKELMSKINEELTEDELLQLGIDSMRTKFEDGSVEPFSFINAFAFAVEQKRPEFSTKLKLFRKPLFWVVVFQGYIDYKRQHKGIYLMGLVDLLSELFILDYEDKIRALKVLSPVFEQWKVKEVLFEEEDGINFNDVFLRCFRILSERGQANAAVQVRLYDMMKLCNETVHENFQIHRNDPMEFSRDDFVAELRNFCNHLEDPEQANQLGFSFPLAALPLDWVVEFFSEIYQRCKELDIVDSFETHMDFFLWKHNLVERKPKYYPTFIQLIDGCLKSFPDPTKFSTKFYTKLDNIVGMDLTIFGTAVLFNVVFEQLANGHSAYYRSIRLPLELWNFFSMDEYRITNMGLHISDEEVRNTKEFLAMAFSLYAEDESVKFELPKLDVSKFDPDEIAEIAILVLFLTIEHLQKANNYRNKIEPAALINGVSEILTKVGITWNLQEEEFVGFLREGLMTWFIRDLVRPEDDRVFTTPMLLTIMDVYLPSEMHKTTITRVYAKYLLALKEMGVTADSVSDAVAPFIEELRIFLKLDLYEANEEEKTVEVNEEVKQFQNSILRSYYMQ